MSEYLGKGESHLGDKKVYRRQIKKRGNRKSRVAPQTLLRAVENSFETRDLTRLGIGIGSVIRVEGDDRFWRLEEYHAESLPRRREAKLCVQVRELAPYEVDEAPTTTLPLSKEYLGERIPIEARALPPRPPTTSVLRDIEASYLHEQLGEAGIVEGNLVRLSDEGRLWRLTGCCAKSVSEKPGVDFYVELDEVAPYARDEALAEQTVAKKLPSTLTYKAFQAQVRWARNFDVSPARMEPLGAALDELLLEREVTERPMVLPPREGRTESRQGLYIDHRLFVLPDSSAIGAEIRVRTTGWGRASTVKLPDPIEVAGEKLPVLYRCEF